MEQHQLLVTPGGSQRPMDFRSPGAMNLREVFDVSYAVHRAEEEGKRRKNFPQGYGGRAGGLASLNEEYDDDEDEDDEYDDLGDDNLPPQSKVAKSHADVGHVEQKMRSTNLTGQDGNATGSNKQSAAAQARQQAGGQQQQQQQQRGYGQHSPAVAAAAKKQVRNKGGPFELSLDKATLLGRRGGGKGDPSKLRTEVVQ